ncbi:M15 family metallopeptidase [Gryllotalpicola koreensis]|uniref:Peptidase M15B domain-containing protein n=1 Tax=Gryllotalpicola koreensis TaxID=993086 RepID=A0ABP7ZUK0_9MICO
MNATSIVIAGKTYGNGYVPTAVLEPVRNAPANHYLVEYAATQFDAWSDYLYAETGKRLAATADIYQVSSCYRDHANQLWAAANAHTHGLGTAATPGYSNHGLALAVDINAPFYEDADLWKALTESAALFGFDNAEGAAVNELWHWVCVRELATLPHPTTTASQNREDDLMKYYRHGLAIWAMGPGYAHLCTAEEWAQLQTAGATITYDFGNGPASQRAFDVVKAAHTQPSK